MPPPGGRGFIANKRRCGIRQPYDSLVEALFPATFDIVFGVIFLIASCLCVKEPAHLGAATL